MESNPLRLWRKVVESGHVKCVTDDQSTASVIEVDGINTRTTYITCPVDPRDSLGIRLPFLSLLLKKTGDFSFEITVIDDKRIQRQICMSTWQTAKNKKCLCVVQLHPSSFWKHIIINLPEVTSNSFGTNYVETVKIKIHANCRIRCVYFTDRLYRQEELPSDYKLEASQMAPSMNAAMADMSSVGPAGSHDQDLSRGPRIDIALQTTASGEEYICGFHTILYSIGWSPLKFWKKEVKNGHVERIMDEEIKSSAIEVHGRNARSTYITCPPDDEDILSIRQPFLNMLVKKTGEDFSFEITVIDDKKIQRRIIQTTFRNEMKAMIYVVCVPLMLSASWEHISINLAELINNSFGTRYVETVKIEIHANCRIRRVYFTDRLYSYQELPKAFKVNISGQSQTAPSIATVMADKSSVVPAGSGHQDQGSEDNSQTMEAALQSIAVGHEYMRGIQSVLNSIEKDPLQFWKKEVEHGHVECVMDKEINSPAIEVQGRNMETTCITCPPDSRDKLSIRQPFLNLLLKNTGDDFACKITVTDDKTVQRRIILTTFRHHLKPMLYSGCVPIRLSNSWEHIFINLAEVTTALFGTKYVDTVKIKIHANCRIQSVYFSDRLYCHEEMPSDYKVLISGERQTAPRINIVMADQSPLVGHQGPRKKEKKPTGHGDHGRRSKLDQTEAADVDGFQSILNSATKDPLKLWKKEVENGHVQCKMVEEIKSSAIDVYGINTQTTCITFPLNPNDSLRIRLPVFNILLKKTGEDVGFEITMIDDKNVQHQIYLGTYRRDTTSLPPPFHWPLSLSNKWQYVCLNLAEVASSVFRTKYVETVKVKIHANCHIRRVYFTDRLYSYQELPSDYQVDIAMKGY